MGILPFFKRSTLNSSLTRSNFTQHVRGSHRSRFRLACYIAFSYVFLHNILLWQLGKSDAVSKRNVEVAITMDLPQKDEHQRSNMECPTLNELAHRMAAYSSPPKSPSYLKNKQILNQANKYYIESPYFFFTSATENIDRAMSSYGLERVRTNSSKIDSDDPANEDVILFYWSSHLAPVHEFCEGSKCKEMTRIILQTEQLNGIKEQYKDCHLSPKCVLWDFSDFNLRRLQEENLGDSVLLVPHMFQDRLNNVIPSTLKPSKDRSIDAVLFGGMTKRRKEFQAKYIVDYNDTNAAIQHDHDNSLSSQNIRFQLKLNGMHHDYGNAKVCMVVHSLLTDSACEYHRLSEIARFGCILVVENVGDTMMIDALQKCGGVHFAGYNDIAKTIHEQLAYIEETTEPVLKERQEKYDKWWANGIDWDNFLETALGPRERPRD